MRSTPSIFFEDQVWPKRCGHMDGKQVIAAEEHAQKIRAACDAREDKATLIMARIDTRAVNGIEDAIRRGRLYAEAGAELLFIEALRDRDEVERLAKEFEGTGIYLFANMIEGGKTPIIPASDLKAMGYAGVFWSCASLYLVTKTLVENFSRLNQEGTSDSFADQLLPFAEFNRFIGLDRYKALEKYRFRFLTNLSSASAVNTAARSEARGLSAGRWYDHQILGGEAQGFGLPASPLQWRRHPTPMQRCRSPTAAFSTAAINAFSSSKEKTFKSSPGAFFPSLTREITDEEIKRNRLVLHHRRNRFCRPGCERCLRHRQDHRRSPSLGVLKCRRVRNRESATAKRSTRSRPLLPRRRSTKSTL